jgi:hypothetical protein
MARYVFITGGVVSSLGKVLLPQRSVRSCRRAAIRCVCASSTPTSNVDPGTMSPYQHGEVFVTDDGAETDLDLGHYERFTGCPATRYDNITRLPQVDGTNDQVVVSCARWFHRRPHGSSPIRASGLPPRNPTDNAGPISDMHPRRPHRRDRHFTTASVRNLILRDGKLAALAPADHELPFTAADDLAGNRIIEESVSKTIHHNKIEVVK